MVSKRECAAQRTIDMGRLTLRISVLVSLDETARALLRAIMSESVLISILRIFKRGGTMQTQEMEHSRKAKEEIRYPFIEGVFDRVEAVSPRTFATAAALSVGSSLLLRLLGRRHDAIFVGEWAPTLLMMGLYTKAMSETRRGLSEGQAIGGSSEKVTH